MILYDWAALWGVPTVAIKDLERRIGIEPSEPPATPGTSEAAIQSQRRVEASKIGGRLWRNNNGAYYDERGSFIRYGLANDSAQMNKRIKSSDLIGIRPIVVTVAMVGSTIGQFWSEEVKAGDWVYSGTEREQAQLAWINLINSLGGYARFVNKGAE